MGRMSDLVVPVTIIKELKEHPNADKLELAIVAGWQIVVGKGDFKPGDIVVHVPPDSVIPEDLGVALGVWDYTSHGRVKHIKLRKEPSFGFIVPISAVHDTLRDKGVAAVDLGANLAVALGVTKYEPPVRGGGNNIKSGQPSRELHGFPKYTDIQNLRHYPTAFEEGESVVVTEKIHGTNSRIGYVNGLRLAGSRRLRRRDPRASLMDTISEWQMLISEAPKGKKMKMLSRAWRQIRGRLFGTKDPTDEGSGTYWFPWDYPGVEKMLASLAMSHTTVVLYGEIYGQGIQSMTYGMDEDTGPGYVAFDLKVDGKFLNYDRFYSLCKDYDVPIAPFDGIIEYSLEGVAALSELTSKLDPAGGMREGIVVRPIEDRNDPRCGRAIYKYISDEYLFAKKSDFTEE